LEQEDGVVDKAQGRGKGIWKWEELWCTTIDSALSWKYKEEDEEWEKRWTEDGDAAGLLQIIESVLTSSTNKRLLDEVASVPSKRLRNKISGCKLCLLLS